MERKRITIITGFYGTGKSEFSINYAVKLSKEVEDLAIIDLDIINPYFRSREKEDLFNEHGIKLMSSAYKGKSTLDVPAVSPEIMVPLRNKSYDVIVDLGGDTGGIRVMRGFKGLIEKEDNFDIFYVLNSARPENDSAEKTIDHIEQLENEIGLPINGIINNSHLSKSTTFEIVKNGNQVSQEVSKAKNIPIIYNSVNQKLLDGDDRFNDLEGEIFPLNISLRGDWMS